MMVGCARVDTHPHPHHAFDHHQWGERMRACLEALDGLQVPQEEVRVDEAEVREEGTEEGGHQVALGHGG